MAQNSWLRIAALLYLIFLTRLTMDLYLPSLADIQEEFGTTVSKVKLTMSLYMVGFGISTMTSGILAKRYSKKNVLLVSVGAYVVISLLCSQTRSIDNLIIYRFLLGLTAGAGTVLGRLIVDKDFSDYGKIKVLSYMSTVAAVSPALLPMLGGMINDVYGWRSVFYLITSAGVVGFIAIQMNLKKMHVQKSFQIKETFNNFRLLIKNKTFLFLMSINSAVWALLFIYANSSTFIFQEVYNLTASEYSKYFACSAIGYALGSFVVRFYAKNFALEKIMIIISIITLITSSILLITSYKTEITPNMYTAFYFVILMSCGVCMPSCQALSLRHFKYCSSDALSLHFFIQLVSVATLSVVINSFNFDMQKMLITTTFILSVAIFLALLKVRSIIAKD
ncbi:MAG: MFS transporter [Rickettsiales bacterium]